MLKIKQSSVACVYVTQSLIKFAVGRMNNEVFCPRRRWMNGNYIGMSENILEIDWNKLFIGNEIDCCYSILVEKIRQICEKFLPESVYTF